MFNWINFSYNIFAFAICSFFGEGVWKIVTVNGLSKYLKWGKLCAVHNNDSVNRCHSAVTTLNLIVTI